MCTRETMFVIVVQGNWRHCLLKCLSCLCTEEALCLSADCKPFLLNRDIVQVLLTRVVVGLLNHVSANFVFILEQ